MDWGTLAWQIFWCLLLAFLLGFILGWLLNWLFGKDRYSKYESDISSRDEEIRGLKSKISAASADTEASAKLRSDLSAMKTENSDLRMRLSKFESNSIAFKAENTKLKEQIASFADLDTDNLKALQNENADLKSKLSLLENDAQAKITAAEEMNAKLKTQLENLEEDTSAKLSSIDSELKTKLAECRDENEELRSKISTLESDLSSSESSTATAATLGALGGSAVTAVVSSSSDSDENIEWNDDYDKIKARLNELEVLATDDEEDTEEDLQIWTSETESLQMQIAVLKNNATSESDKSRSHELDANADSLLEILRKARADKAAGIAKVRRQGYGKGVRDDLKEIEGVGPVLEKVLNGLDIWTFREIALWSPEKVAEVSEHLPSFKDRIVRENWVEQSKQLHLEHYGESV